MILSLKGPGVKTYKFDVELEIDEDGWHVYYPPWSSIGASTWGYTRKEALKHIQEVLSMIIEEFREEGKPVHIKKAKISPQGASVLVTV